MKELCKCLKDVLDQSVLSKNQHCTCQRVVQYFGTVWLMPFLTQKTVPIGENKRICLLPLTFLHHTSLSLLLPCLKQGHTITKMPFWCSEFSLQILTHKYFDLLCDSIFFSFSYNCDMPLYQLSRDNRVRRVFKSRLLLLAFLDILFWNIPSEGFHTKIPLSPIAGEYGFPFSRCLFK